MDEDASPSDSDRELRDLRARAFGPHPDIEKDPIALARLEALEEALVAARAVAVTPSQTATSDAAADVAPAVGPTPTTEPAREPDAVAAAGSGASIRRLATTSAGRLWLIAGVAAAAIALVYGVDWIVGPRPDATMHPIAAEPDVWVVSQLEGLGPQAPYQSTLRAYEAYRGIELWSGLDVWGSPCLFGFDRSLTTMVFAECIPREGELFGDVGDWPHPMEFEGLAEGSVIRFQLLRDSVDVFVYAASDGG